jgi:hypothetical protein
VKPDPVIRAALRLVAKIAATLVKVLYRAQSLGVTSLRPRMKVLRLSKVDQMVRVSSLVVLGVESMSVTMR